MLIEWDSGERITTTVELQERILARMEKEASAPITKASRSSPAWMGKSFSGLSQEDFKENVDGTHWRSREQLGGAVARVIESPEPMNSWSIYRRPEIHWAAISRYRSDEAWVQSKFFIRLQAEFGLYGFYIERSNEPEDARVDWLKFVNWLAVEDQVDWLHQLLEQTGMWIFDPYPEYELAFNRSIRPKGEGWLVEFRDSSSQTLGKAELVKYLSEIDDGTWLNLVIGHQRPAGKFLSQGANIASEIAETFNRLIPIYTNRSPQGT